MSLRDKLNLRAKLEEKQRGEAMRVIDIIVKKVGELTDAPKDWLENRSRFSEYTEPRQVLMYILRKRVSLSQQLLSSFFLWDRTTIYANSKKVSDLMSVDKVYRDYVMTILDAVDTELEMNDGQELKGILSEDSTDIIRRKARRRMAEINRSVKDVLSFVNDSDMQGYQKTIIIKKMKDIKDVLSK
jgi:hypothetical protein